MDQRNIENYNACVSTNGTECSRLLTDSGAYTPPGSKTAQDVIKNNNRAMYAAEQIFSDANASGRDLADGYDNRGVWGHLSQNIFNSSTPDGTISRESIKEMLRESDNLWAGTFFSGTYNSKFTNNLKYLDDNWDKPEVQRLLTADGDISKESVRKGSETLTAQNKMLAEGYGLNNPLAGLRPVGDQLPLTMSFDPTKKTDTNGLLAPCAITSNTIKDGLVQAATVKSGEGPWSSAARILKMDGQAASNRDIQALTTALSEQYKADQALTGGNTSLESLKANHQLLTPKNQYLVLQRIKDQELQQRLKRSFNLM